MAYIIVGTITNTHGVDGTLKVRTESDFKRDRYKQGASLHVNIDGKRTKVTVERHREHKGMDLLDFEEFSSLDEVEHLKGGTLEILAEDRPPLRTDEFYYDDLVGCTVKTDRGRVGVVKEVFEVPQGTMLRVETEAGGETLVPFLKVFVKEVDTESKMIHIDEIEGLL